MEDITRCREDMNFSSSKFYVRDSSCHGNIKFISSSKLADDAVFDDFPKISDQFPKISEDFPKLFRRPDERFRTFSEHFRTFSEDCRRLPKATEDVSIIHQQILV